MHWSMDSRRRLKRRMQVVCHDAVCSVDHFSEIIYISFV